MADTNYCTCEYGRHKANDKFCLSCGKPYLQDGKVTCIICGKGFTPRGFKKHLNTHYQKT